MSSGDTWAGRCRALHGEEPYLADLEIPEGMAPGLPPLRTDLHLHPLAEHVRRFPGHYRNQRGALRGDVHRSRPARRDVLVAGGFSLTASKWHAGGASRAWACGHGSTTSAPARAFSSVRMGGGSSSGCPIRSLRSTAQTVRRWLSAANSTGSRTTRAVSRKTRKTSSCWRTTTR